MFLSEILLSNRVAQMILVSDAALMSLNPSGFFYIVNLYKDFEMNFMNSLKIIKQ